MGKANGAVTSILYMKETDEKGIISCIVSDSAFSSLSKLIDEFINKVIALPQFFIDMLKTQVGDIIEKKVNFRIEKIEPIEGLEKIKSIPILFCHGLDDTFINNRGQKEIVIFEGENNEKRPLQILQVISLFFIII